MKLLLDTHTFLWFIAGDPQLPLFARQLIESPQQERLLSVGSLWEITIKAALGRLTVPLPISRLVTEHVWANAIDLLPVKPTHLDELYRLPHYHNDPFDRLLIAQARDEGMIVVTRDGAFADYAVETAWATAGG